MTTIHVCGHGLLQRLNSQTEAALGRYTVVNHETEASLVEVLPEVEFLYGYGFGDIAWETATKLRMVQVPGSGVDLFLPAKGLSDDVIITNARGAHEPHMPEFIMAQVLGLAYQIPRTARRQDDHDWRRSFPVMSLQGRTMCLMGLGAIGQSVAKRAKAFGMTVRGVRRSGEPMEFVDQMFTPSDRLEAMRDADVVVVVVPLTEETRGMVGAAELAAMNSGSIMVDVSRGGVSDMAAVTEALNSGQLAGASVDVFETEPLPTDSALWDVPNLLVTPHAAGMSADYFSNLIQVLLANVESVLEGERPETQIDRAAGY